MTFSEKQNFSNEEDGSNLGTWDSIKGGKVDDSRNKPNDPQAELKKHDSWDTQKTIHFIHSQEMQDAKKDVPVDLNTPSINTLTFWDFSPQVAHESAAHQAQGINQIWDNSTL